MTKEEIEKTTKELKELVEKFCEGSFMYKVLDENDQEIRGDINVIAQ